MDEKNKNSTENTFTDDHQPNSRNGKNRTAIQTFVQHCVYLCVEMEVSRHHEYHHQPTTQP